MKTFLPVLMAGCVLACNETDASLDGEQHLSDDEHSSESHAADGGKPLADAETEVRGALTLKFEEVGVPDDFDRGLLGHVYLPGGDELLLWTKLGEVGHFRWQGAELKLLGRLELGADYVGWDCGISAAVGPKFTSRGFIYFGMCNDLQGSAVYRYYFDPARYDEFAASKSLVFGADESRSTRGIHNIGSIGFDPEGDFWAVFGDKAFADNGQNLETELGALVRFSIVGDGADIQLVPKAGIQPIEDGASEYIYAYGLRSPFTATLDHRGYFWVGDVGRDDFEELNLITEFGQNLGWPDAEGPCTLGAVACDGLTEPLASWPHDFDHDYVREDPELSATQGRVAWVGFEYQPNADDPYAGQLDHRVFFGDACMGFVRVVAVDDDGLVAEDRHVGNLRGAYSWGQSATGLVTAVSYANCTAPDPGEEQPSSGFYVARPVFADEG